MAGIREYSGTDRTTSTMALVSLVSLIAIYWIFSGGSTEVGNDILEISSSPVIPTIALAIFRTMAALTVITTLCLIVASKTGLSYNVLDYESREYGPRRIFGTHRLAAFTMWSFFLMGAYFAIAAYASWADIIGLEVPNSLLIICPATLASSCACALLVTVTVTVMLIPEAHERGDDFGHYFRWDSQMMHNGNVIILGFELIVTGTSVGIEHISFPILFGSAYVIFSALFAMKKGFYFYDFIDPRLNGAPVIHLTLLAVLACMYIGVLLLTSVIEWNRSAGTLITVALIFLMTTFRDPREGTLSP